MLTGLNQKRKIYGPIQENGEWRIRMNHEINRMFNRPTIIKDIRSKRLSWLGHVERVDDKRNTKKVLRKELNGKRPKGRPRKRWIDGINQDLKDLGIREWKNK
uniref:Uncharacterized protein LOC114325621 n=1 Tax=Diabrotica virgifera virgifera TaxID=50390 RepID=A0A6P7F738_DIAVI